MFRRNNLPLVRSTLPTSVVPAFLLLYVYQSMDDLLWVTAVTDGLPRIGLQETEEAPIEDQACYIPATLLNLGFGIPLVDHQGRAILVSMYMHGHRYSNQPSRLHPELLLRHCLHIRCHAFVSPS